MSQRNGQNPVRSENNFKKESRRFIGSALDRNDRGTGMMQCPSCKAKVPPKPGFRIKSLKCPKCGAAMHK